MTESSPTKRQYSGAEIAEAIMVYDELRRCGAVNKGQLDFEKLTTGYRNEGWGKNVNIQWPLAATVEELPPRPQEGAEKPKEEG